MGISEKLHKINKYINYIDSTVKYIYRAPGIDRSFDDWENTILNNDPIPSNKYVEEELVELSSVNFYDYDGTVLYTYDKDEFLSLTEMPPLPSQQGLICQGWNWDLSRAKEYVGKYDDLNIGATYTTDDGKTRFYIELINDNTTVVIKYIQSANRGVIVNWGDGTSETIPTPVGIQITTSYHTYSTKGEYVISLSVVSGNLTIRGIDESLTKVEIGNSVKTIGTDTFRNCYSLQSVTIPNSVTSIDSQAFYDCHSLQSITIPDSVTTIGSSAFEDCSSLQSITIPNSVTSIGSQAFYDCHSLQSVTIPDSVTTISRYAFYSCTSLQSITIPDSVTSIGTYAFSHCYSLQSITIPDSVTEIGSSAFSYCTSLQSITIPDSVTDIDSSAFSYCTSLRNVVIGNSVTAIGNYAFQYCSSLQHIDFTSHTSIPTIGTNAFDYILLDFEIRVPFALYDAWCNATNWATYKNNIKHGLMDVAVSTYNSLSITADDVSGLKTSTTIYYTANANYINKWTGDVETVDIQGTAISDPFPQNTSTTDTVERTITFELGGLTATTTITQGVCERQYTIDLNGQWRLSSSIPNPDSSLCDGVYESFSNYNVHNSYATMYIDIVGYETFKLYIRSYAESNYDYVMVSQLDQNITGDTSYSNTTLVKAHTRGKQQSSVALSGYTPVEFTGIDKGEHRITIVYRKDSSSNSGNDRGYVLVENK